MGLTTNAYKEVTKNLANFYRLGDEVAKSQILDALMALTGWHRDYAWTALR